MINKNQIGKISKDKENKNQNSLYWPKNLLLDTVMAKLNIRKDIALAKRLEVNPSTISKIRHQKIITSAAVLISMHEETGLSIAELMSLEISGSENKKICKYDSKKPSLKHTYFQYLRNNRIIQ